MKKEEKGITLVALIITIIILLILAVVSIMAVTGTGLFSKTNDAVDKYQNSTEKENTIFDEHIQAISNKGSGNSSKLFNKIKTIFEENNYNEFERLITEEGMRQWIADYNSANESGVYYLELDNEECFVYLEVGETGPTNVKEVKGSSDYDRYSYVERFKNDLDALRALIGKNINTLTQSKDEEKDEWTIQIPGFSISNPIVSYSEGNEKISIEYYDYLTFDFDLNFENDTSSIQNGKISGIVASVTQNG